jgi:hypothetical protein
MMVFALALAAVVLIRSPRRPSVPPEPPLRLVLTLLAVEIGAGQSVLGALQNAAVALPDHVHLSRAARLATVTGLSESVVQAGAQLSPVLAQLARAQRSGASLTATLRRLIDEDLVTERGRRLAKARALPTRLLVPLTLLMLPGLVLLLYAPSLIALYHELTGAWS